MCVCVCAHFQFDGQPVLRNNNSRAFACPFPDSTRLARLERWRRFHFHGHGQHSHRQHLSALICGSFFLSTLLQQLGFWSSRLRLALETAPVLRPRCAAGSSSSAQSSSIQPRVDSHSTGQASSGQLSSARSTPQESLLWIGRSGCKQREPANNNRAVRSHMAEGCARSNGAVA